MLALASRRCIDFFLELWRHCLLLKQPLSYLSTQVSVGHLVPCSFFKKKCLEFFVWCFFLCRPRPWRRRISWGRRRWRNRSSCFGKSSEGQKDKQLLTWLLGAWLKSVDFLPFWGVSFGPDMSGVHSFVHFVSIHKHVWDILRQILYNEDPF